MTVFTDTKPKIRKRDGSIVDFDETRIRRALTAAFCTSEWNLPKDHPLDSTRQHTVDAVFYEVIDKVMDGVKKQLSIDVEWIQDVVELILMRQGYYTVVKDYILYRQNRAVARKLLAQDDHVITSIRDEQCNSVAFYRSELHARLQEAANGLGPEISIEKLAHLVESQLFEGITRAEILSIAVMAARSFIESNPIYDKLTTRLFLMRIDGELLGKPVPFASRGRHIQAAFSGLIQKGITHGRIDPALGDFDLERLALTLQPERDLLINFLGMQTLYDRYLLHVEGIRIESPQIFWMRVAMGLALKEPKKEKAAIAFYHVLSTLRYLPGTPTLFNSGTCKPQLSSCYLLTVQDDLDSIFKMISDDAKLSKWAGGLGNDWTQVRATNAPIKGTNGTSQGVIPFLKIANDTALAVNQGGKRKGAMCAYLEVWHLDIEDFIDLRKNTGDERRRTHDMHTANWIPDLFMKRVQEDAEWTIFNPSDVRDLHDTYGKQFETRYLAYEEAARAGALTLYKRISARELWRKMLSRIFETGHPWITFKDPSNIRSTQQHCGVIHSSNLCTEILLNTSHEETAVCNIGSLNLKQHVVNGKLDYRLLQETIDTAIQMLDNVIDINFYPTMESARANMRHRPVGLGIMGFQDVLHSLNIDYASEKAVTFSDQSMEYISYYAILASSRLAKEKGKYTSYAGSSWDRGLLPIDTLALLEKERGVPLEIDSRCSLDWEPVRKHVKQHGMRNSQVMAIAPTATISQIAGVSQSIEPLYAVLFAKSNLSGDFTCINESLVTELKKVDLWDQEMLDELKYEDGSIQNIERIPEAIRKKYKTAFEIGADWIIRCAAARQKWIDMGQSLNLYLLEPSGKKLDEMYFHAWRCGLKTTYYLRTRAATQVEKSTLDINRYGVQPKWMKNKSESSEIAIERKACSIADPDCEACQ